MDDERNADNFGSAFAIIAIIALTLAAGFVTAVYGYMDHVNVTVSLKAAQHDSWCMHQACTVSSQSPSGQP